MRMKELLRKLGIGIPRWAYAQECQICKKSFINAGAHIICVSEKSTEAEHEKAILLLKRLR